MAVLPDITAAPIASADAYSANNIAQAASNPTPAPDDLLGIRDQIYADLGIPDLQAGYQSAYQQYLDTAQNQDVALNQIEGKTLGMNTIRGAQAETSRQYGQLLGGQSRGLQALGSSLNAARMEASEQFNIRSNEIQQMKSIMLQYPGAGITFGDSFEKVTGKLNDYAEEQEKKAYKDSLKQQLLAMGSSVSGLSTNELEKKLKKKNKAAYERAQEEADLRFEGLKLDIENTKSIMANRGGGGGTKEVDLSKDINQRLLANELLNEAENQGLYGNYAYQYAQQQAIDLGLGTEETSVFDNQLRVRFGNNIIGKED